MLLDNIITEVIDWDKDDDFDTNSNQENGAHLRKLVTTIRSCGAGFDVREPKNPADKKGSGTYEFTSLLGNDKKYLLVRVSKKIADSWLCLYY